MDALTCEICGQKEGMQTEADIRTHMLLEHEESGPSCPLCDLGDLSLEELQLHMNTAHEDVLSPTSKTKSSTTHDAMQDDAKTKHRIAYNASGRDASTKIEITHDALEQVEKSSSVVSNHSPGKNEHHINHNASVGAANTVSEQHPSHALSLHKKPAQKSKLKMAAIFPGSVEGNSNGFLHDSESSQEKSNLKSQEIELSDFQLKQNQDKTGCCAEYPLQLRGPEDDQSSTSNKSNNAQKKCANTSADDSLEMVSFGLNGSALLISDSEDDSVSIPGSSTDSPSRKRPRNATNSSMSDCSSVTDEQGREKVQKGTLKRFFESLTPKKTPEKNASVNSPSGIWSGVDGTAPDSVFQDMGQSSSGYANDSEKPECPFCDLQGLDPDDMTQHIENAHGDLLSPTETCRPKGANQSQVQHKTPVKTKQTLLSLSKNSKQVESAILCPFCSLGSYDPDFLTVHIHAEHPEAGSGSPSGINSTNPTDKGYSNGAEAGPSTSDSACPVCGVKGLNQADLAAHVEGHFEDTSGKSGTVHNEDDRLAMELAKEEKQLRERREREEFKQLQAQYGMDGSAGYQQQSETSLENAVARGQISVTDYHQQRGRIKQIVATGVDDGRSRTQGLIANIESFYSKDNRNVSYGRVCSDMDHFGGTPGDRGWGCGYRNLQMLLSGMIRDPNYKKVVFNGREAIPSIGKLQQLIETAWEQGWDPQGREQLGGTVCNTRKWIGATEIVAVLSYLKTKYILVDFHKATGPNGTHPRMFEWVRDYFGQPGTKLFNRGNQVKSNKMPLYLQHQGHSRTIIGYEVLKDGAIRLLIFDPSMSHGDIQSLQEKDLNAQVMRPIRKSLAQMKNKQYQIVGVQGIYSEREHQESKLIRSQRIP